MPRLKVCGLMREEDVEVVDEVADYAGFILGPPGTSPRVLGLAEAVGLTSILSKAKPVLVAVEMKLEDAIEMAVKSGTFRALQFHEPSQPAEAVKASELLASSGISFAPVILYRNGWIPEHPSMYNGLDYEYLLIDAPKHSTERYELGVKVPLSAYREAVRTARRVAAGGGINLGNVRYVALQNVWMIDVSSGIEAEPGVKDHLLIREMAEKVKGRC